MKKDINQNSHNMSRIKLSYNDTLMMLGCTYHNPANPLPDLAVSQDLQKVYSNDPLITVLNPAQLLEQALRRNELAMHRNLGDVLCCNATPNGMAGKNVIILKDEIREHGAVICTKKPDFYQFDSETIRLMLDKGKHYMSTASSLVLAQHRDMKLFGP